MSSFNRNFYIFSKLYGYVAPTVSIVSGSSTSISEEGGSLDTGAGSVDRQPPTIQVGVTSLGDPIYGANPNYRVTGSAPDVQTSERQLSSDPFRSAAGNYWFPEGTSPFPIYGDLESYNPDLDRTENGETTLYRRRQTYNIVIRNEKTNNLKGFPFFETRHQFEVFAPKDRYNNNALDWIEYTFSLVDLREDYYDFSFELGTPLSKSQTDLGAVAKFALFAEGQFDYNYYSPIYETAVQSGENQIENFLPNLYNFLSYRKDIDSENVAVDDKIFQAITAGGQVEANLLRGIGTTDPEDTNIDYFSYFDRFGNVLNSEVSPEEANPFMRNLIFDVDSDSLRKEADKFVSSFPMNATVEFMSSTAGDFASILEDSKLTKSLISYLSEIPRRSELTFDQIEEYSLLSERVERIYEIAKDFALESGELKIDRSVEFESSKLIYLIDLEKWIERVVKGFETSDAEFIFLSDNGEEKVSHFEKILNSVVFLGKLKKLIQRYQRHYVDFSDGKQSYTETVLYKITKFGTGSDPIQTIWLPNTDEIDLVKYIDTQVKFDKQYRYEVSAYQLLIGTTYKYETVNYPLSYTGGNPVITPRETESDDDESESDDEGTLPTETTALGGSFSGGTSFEELVESTSGPRDFGSRVARFRDTGGTSTTVSEGVGAGTNLNRTRKFETKYAQTLFPQVQVPIDEENDFKMYMSVLSKPFVKMVEVPYFEIVGTVIDDPPVAPNVDLIPYLGVDNQLRINLNSSVGSYDLQPVVFNQREQQTIDKIRQTKNLSDNSKITFTTDDRVAFFEIFRMETPPKTIQDFDGNLLRTINTDVDLDSPQKASAATFVDEIQPNRDYYYTFRSIDIHGKVSNPTQVYRARLVRNSGAVYPLVEVYTPDNSEQGRTATKSCKKLLNISPRITQTLINQAESNLGDGSSAKNVKTVKLGLEERSLFGRKFKIRLTSQKTGKQVDLNVTFTSEVRKT